MEWTKEQEKVISVRDRNILVSAAAGSGKTAVLVERIMQIVMNKDNPVDVDKLLVVTFTNAAANEMRERILKAFEEKLLEIEDNQLREHLEKQCTYIHNANISTIDGFCQKVIKEYISLTDVDPSYRIADNSELVLMKEDALVAVLDRWYEEMSPAFMNFVDTYSSKVGDDNIEQLILKLYNYACSYPNPEKWIMECGVLYDISDINEWKHSEMSYYIKDTIKQALLMTVPDAMYALALCTEENGLLAYAKSFESDLEFMKNLEQEEDIEIILNTIKDNKYKTFGRVSGANETVKSEVAKIRDNYKKIFNNLKKRYATQPLQKLINDINDCKESVQVLIQLTLDFSNEFANIKKEKNVLDFSDIEHIALGILAYEENGEYIQTAAAKEMAEDFVEIMIDEYQDSNFVQEILLNAVSSCKNGKNNIFMVGDVKQSIYKFRQAKPELFLDKYNKYADDYASGEMKIVLSKNFRSRKEVIESANLLFSQIMSKDLGGIEYDDDSKLYLGAEYTEVQQNQDTELIMIDTSKEKIGSVGEYHLSDGSDEDLDDIEKLEAEAVVVANRIKELINDEKPFMITDKKTKELRPAQYKDIVILFRSKMGSMDKYADILIGKGIPVTSVLKESMLNTFEINVILNFMRIIDNPRQDIPMVSILKHIFSYNENQLSEIVLSGQRSFYENLLAYEGTLKAKNDTVLKVIDKYRHLATYMPIHKLIRSIIDETYFIDFISSMENGEQRLYNIDIFIEKAENFAKGTYTGLFNFIRYIEKLKTYNADINEDISFSEEENTVKLMTIHKSKGLEFPIVFVAAMGKTFNQTEARAKVNIHSRLGIGIDKYDLNRRIKYKTIIKEMIVGKIYEEDLAEEIRVLYVALTRAKEKLILVGNGKISDRIKFFMQFAKRRDLTYPKEVIMCANCYLDWIIMALVRHKSFDNIRKLLLDERKYDETIYEQKGDYQVTLIDVDSIMYSSVKDIVNKSLLKEKLTNWDTSKIYSDDIRASINERFSYVYEYENDTRIKAKHSVSDIKHTKMEIDEFAENKMHLNSDDEEYVPVFMRTDDVEGDVNMGALRGSAVHRLFELFDYDMESYEEADIKSMLGNIKSNGTMSEEEILLIIPKIFVSFMKTVLGERMQRAHKNNQLFRERPFVMGMKARDVDEAYDSDELVVVQGIIDAFFYEGDEVVIVDYKTDNVTYIEELVGRYKAQLDCYGAAIEKVTGKKVKEKIIYSTKFSDIIVV